MDKDIVPANTDLDWQAIINRIVDELKPQDAPDNVVRVMEYLISGWPLHKAAREVNVSSHTVRQWLSEYPAMAAAVAQGRQAIVTWRMHQLEQQFTQALQKSQEILGVQLDGTYVDDNGEIRKVSARTLTAQAAHVRYLLNLMTGRDTGEITVTHEFGETVLKARDDALDYLASQLKHNDDPIDVVYKVIDVKRDTVGPVLDANGSPFYGEMGEVDINETGTQCHICGKRYAPRGFRAHVAAAHDMTAQEYELTFMLTEGVVVNLEKTGGIGGQ